jgi:ketosteroid isomerase-like protein
MSQKHVETIRSIYEAVNRRDWDAAFRDQQPDVELILPPGPHAGPFRGRDEIQEYWEGFMAAFDAATAEPEKVLESGDQVVVLVRTRARPKGSSAEVEVRNGHLWTIRDGKIASMRLFPEPEKALEAAGLTE